MLDEFDIVRNHLGKTFERFAKHAFHPQKTGQAGIPSIPGFHLYHRGHFGQTPQDQRADAAGVKGDRALERHPVRPRSCSLLTFRLVIPLSRR